MKKKQAIQTIALIERAQKEYCETCPLLSPECFPEAGKVECYAQLNPDDYRKVTGREPFDPLQVLRDAGLRVRQIGFVEYHWTQWASSVFRDDNPPTEPQLFDMHNSFFGGAGALYKQLDAMLKNEKISRSAIQRFVNELGQEFEAWQTELRLQSIREKGGEIPEG